jgi:DNA invertase Pin-like site-specific DNA recombinase
LAAQELGCQCLRGQNIEPRAIAEFERQLINERAAEGRAQAMADGVRFGRKPRLTEEQIAAVRKERETWTGSAAALAQKHGISRATLYRMTEDQR